MQKLSLKQKLGLILFGICLFFIILEIGLRLGGCIILSFQEHQNRLALKEKGAYKIICLGASTTAEGGRYAYPAQLEEILNAKKIGIRFKVINKGVDGVDSMFILSKLRENLDKYSPDMVVTMMGENDVSRTLPYIDKPDLQSKLFFREFRIFKVTRLLCLRMMNKAREIKSLIMKKETKDLDGKDKLINQQDSHISEAEAGDLVGIISQEASGQEDQRVIDDLVASFSINKSQGTDFAAADRAIGKAIETSSNNPELLVDLFISLGDSYVCQGRFEESEAVLKQAIALNPGNSQTYVILAFCYWSQAKYDQAEAMLKKAIEIEPKQQHRAYSDLIYCYEIQGKNQQIQELCESIRKSGFDDPFFLGIVARYYTMQRAPKEASKYFRKADERRLKNYNPVTYYNYCQLAEIVMQRGIKLVCVQHPMRNVESLKKLLDYRTGIIFVDNENSFKQAVKNGKYEDYFRDCFGGDFGHATPEGNRLLAENVSRAILKEIFEK